MNVFGQLKINDVISIDTADMLAAFVGDECRGVAKIQYIEPYDMYEVFIDIYSNNESGENVYFKIWDASKGTVHINVSPDYIFQLNDIHGTPSNPIMISTNDASLHQTVMSGGWKWISFNLSNPFFSNVNATLSSLSPQPGDQVKTLIAFDNYDEYGWSGSITNTGGFKNETGTCSSATSESTF